ncbi:MAG: permease-like cell division protein FtsX [Candidatus Pacebacteria bacterium]|nr:permease-like cell division protein FtsX [Candidatus Paceibacterota bacterium]
MFWVDVKRIMRSGVVSFRRNGIVSVAAVLITTITLSVIAGLIFLQAILNFSLAEIRDKVDVTIYFTSTAAEATILDLKGSLEKLPEVAGVEYVSEEQALALFKERHQNDYITLQALEEIGDNPLGASLNVKAIETSQYESVVKFLEGDSAAVKTASASIDKINYYQNKAVIDRLSILANGAERLGYIISFVMVAISIMITFTTIRLAIFIAREEIGIMKLVGAGTRYIRGPFMMEGIIYGLVASVITMVIYYPFTYWLGNHLSDFFGMNLYDYFTSNFFQIFAIVLASGIIIGVISSWIAISRYLRK